MVTCLCISPCNIIVLFSAEKNILFRILLLKECEKIHSGLSFPAFLKCLFRRKMDEKRRVGYCLPCFTDIENFHFP